MYQVNPSSQLDALNARYTCLPPYQPHIINRTSLVLYLGRFHTTHNFSIETDGSRSTLHFSNNSNNDAFTLDIQSIRLNFDVTFTKNSRAGYDERVVCSKVPAFLISIGAPKKKKNRGHDDSEKDNEDAYINELVLKSLKINITNSDVRAVLGSLENWHKHDMILWDSILERGFLKTLGHDFNSFCNTFIMLPLYFYDASKPSISEYLSKLSSFRLVKKLTRFFLYGEDPSAKGWMHPTRDYFEEPKSIVDIFEQYSIDLSERFSNFETVRTEVVRELNTKNRNELEEKYPPTTFPNIQSVEKIYPLHALRTLHLMSWCATDFEVVQELVHTSHAISKSSRSKHIIKKRGKFQKYNTYEISGFFYEYHPWSYVPTRKTKFDVVNKNLID